MPGKKSTKKAASKQKKVTSAKKSTSKAKKPAATKKPVSKQKKAVSAKKSTGKAKKVASKKSPVTKTKKVASTKSLASKTKKVASTKSPVSKTKKVAGTKSPVSKTKKIAGTKSPVSKTKKIAGTKRPAVKRKKAATPPVAPPPQAPELQLSESGFIDAGRLETEIYEPDPEVKEAFAEASGLGDSSRGTLIENLRENSPSESPQLSGGDIDAAWDQSDASGEESVGGSNPTPDQDIVDELGKAVGLTYQDNEPLRTEDKVSDRDKNRWELEPESSEDFNERNKD